MKASEFCKMNLCLLHHFDIILHVKVVHMSIFLLFLEMLKAIYFESCQCFVVILINYYSGSSEKKEEKSVNGEKEDSVENGEDEVPEDEEEICYDKNKSFFDNISCEATERAKGLVKFLYINEYLLQHIDLYVDFLDYQFINFTILWLIKGNALHVYNRPSGKFMKLFLKPASVEKLSTVTKYCNFYQIEFYYNYLS